MPKSLVDLGGVAGAPQTGPNSFVFTGISAKKAPTTEVGAPQRVGAPQWEILDPQLEISELKIWRARSILDQWSVVNVTSRFK